MSNWEKEPVLIYNDVLSKGSGLKEGCGVMVILVSAVSKWKNLCMCVSACVCVCSYMCVEGAHGDGHLAWNWSPASIQMEMDKCQLLQRKRAGYLLTLFLSHEEILLLVKLNWDFSQKPELKACPNSMKTEPSLWTEF